MDHTVRELVNRQVAREFHAAYLYLAMAAHLERQSYEGFASWMRAQAKEETEHAMRLFDYLLERGESVALGAIEEPGSDFGTPLNAFSAALEHERKVSAQIAAIDEAAREANDRPTQILMQWFIEEQVEEEDMAGRAVDQLEMAGDHPAALLMLDSKFGSRGGGEGG